MPDELDSTACPMCWGAPVFIGMLGSNACYRCRDCGWDWSETVELEDDNDAG